LEAIVTPDRNGPFQKTGALSVLVTTSGALLEEGLDPDGVPIVPVADPAANNNTVTADKTPNNR
jgi:hypothetical protein